MSDSTSLNNAILEVMISSKNELVYIHDLSDLTLQIIFDAEWASMNVDLKCPISWTNSGYGSSRRFDLHSRIEETCSTGCIHIVCYQVLRHPSEHGPRLMG